MMMMMPARTLLLLSPLLALAACEPGPEAPPPPGGPMTEAEPLSDPVAEDEEEPVASIIRPDLAVEPAIELPPEPLALTVTFPEGSDLTPAAERQLAAMLDARAVVEGWPIVLRGHSDSSGSDAANLRASRQRAAAVAGWLVERGIAEERIRIVALGEQNPIAPNVDPEGEPDERGRARNRRVEISVAPLEDVATAREAATEGSETVLGEGG